MTAAPADVPNAVLPPIPAIVAAGEAALATLWKRPCRLANPVELGGSERSTVLRVGVEAIGEVPPSVVLKAYRREQHSMPGGFLDEAAGLAFSGAGPRLLAVDPVLPLVAMEDLGTSRNLADLLLGEDPERAAAAAKGWATAFGRLCAESAGREREFAALRQRFGGEPANPEHRTWLPEAFAKLPERFAALGATAPPGLDAELNQLLAMNQPGEFAVFSPGDVCPDNHLLTPEGVRFLDFESAGFHSVFLDAAYTRLPFATCWCVFTPPAGLTAMMEAAFRGEVVRAFPILADDVIWDRGVRHASAIWVLSMSTWLLPDAIDGTAAEQVPANGRAPRRRPYLVQRWRWLVEELERVADLPAATALLRRSLARASERWTPDDQVLLGYPAFRGTGPEPPGPPPPAPRPRPDRPRPRLEEHRRA